MSNPLHNEKELLLKITVGDELAFCRIFDHYSSFVYSFGFKLVRSKDVAEEIVQDIFLKVWENKEKLKEVDNFGAYLNILVRNHSFNLLRKLAQQQKPFPEMAARIPIHDDTTQNMVDYREILRILEEVLEHLPEQQRTIYTLCHFEGLKYDEVAQKLNMSIHTVHYHIKLALKNIRKDLIKKGIAYQALLFFFINY